MIAPRSRLLVWVALLVLPLAALAGLVQALRPWSSGAMALALLVAAADAWLARNALRGVTVAMPELILGSADLTPSNNTRTKNLIEIKPGMFEGRYLHYGIREHGMAGAMNGMAAHGGLRPAGGTFLIFSDYARPAMRIANSRLIAASTAENQVIITNGVFRGAGV